MLTLVNILIIFFIVLILYQILLANNIIEGLQMNSTSPNTNTNINTNTYQPYDTNNPNNALILAQQNAGNIAYLKQQIDSVLGMNQEVQDLSGNVTALQTQVNGILTQQQEYATQLTGGQPPQVTGAVDTTDNNSS